MSDDNEFIYSMGQAVKKLIVELKSVQELTKELVEISNLCTSEIIILRDRVTELERFQLKSQNIKKESNVTKYINLTPHIVNIQTTKGEILSFPSEAQARVAQTSQVLVETAEGIPIKSTSYGEIEGLPDPQENTIFIVSMLVAQAARRLDVLSPDSGPSACRDANGNILYVRALVSY